MPPSVLDLRHLRTLCAVEDTGSLSRAADLLCLTQSALSHQLRALESHYGEALMYRQGGQVRFTPTGTELLKLARAVLPMVDQTELTLSKLNSGASGPLRVVVECHTCFDWLMPAMDVYRQRWPDAELDIVSGFHADPVGLLHDGQAELAIVSESVDEPGVSVHPLFSFEMMAVVPAGSKLASRAWLKPSDFQEQTLITYPVPDDMLDVVRHFLKPAGVQPTRRTAQLTVALLQLVASNRGLSVLPVWAIDSHVRKGYVAQVRLGKRGLHSTLYAATPLSVGKRADVQDFLSLMRDHSLRNLPGVSPA